MVDSINQAEQHGILSVEDFVYTIRDRPGEEPFLFRLSYTRYGEVETLSIPSFALPLSISMCVHNGELVKVENLYPNVA